MARYWLRAGAMLLLVGARSLCAQESPSIFQERVLTGACSLRADPVQTSLWPLVCLRAQMSYQGISRSELHERNVNYGYGEAYFGLHLTETLSLHGRARQYQFLHPTKINAKDTESLFLQIGNVTWSRARVSLGRVDLPFGTNLRPLLEVYDEVYKTQRFWETARYAVRVAFEDLTNTQIDLGVASDEISAEEKPGKEKRHFQVSGRLMLDIPALGGTRFILSGLDEPEKERRISAGFLTRDPTGGVTSFEWVRLLPTEAGSSKKFAQLMRLNYVGDPERKVSWIFEYEDELRRHFLTTIGYHYRWTNVLRLKLNVSYYRARMNADVNHWLLASGLEWHL